MSDAKFFSKGKASELEAELRALDKAGGKSASAKKKDVLKRIVANMTMGTDMSSLFNQVVLCTSIPGYDTKKLIYMYLIHYAKSIPDLATLAVNLLIKDSNDDNPLIRAHAIRTMGYIPGTDIMHSLADVVRSKILDQDPFVRKACVYAVLKLVHQDHAFCVQEGLVDDVAKLATTDANPTVIACAICAVMEILDLVPNCTTFLLDLKFANKLVLALDECSQWYQVYILQAFTLFTPQSPDDALLLAERLTSRLQHNNSAITLTVIRVMIYLMSYLTDPKYAPAIAQLGPKLASPLVTLMGHGPEIQYTTLRNIQIIVEIYPTILVKELPVFFVKYTDPSYVKLAKLDVLASLVNADNCAVILTELKEYASEIDVEFCRRAVKLIGRCALHVESMSEACMNALAYLLETKVPYVLQEAVVVVRDMFRRYPGKFEAMLGPLTDQLDAIDEPDARAAYVWILGQYCTRIENVIAALQLFTTHILADPAPVQLALVTALAKSVGASVPGALDLFNQVASVLVNGQTNPDVRDRVIIYMRLCQHPAAFKKMLDLNVRPSVDPGSDAMKVALRNELMVHIGSLASVFHKPPSAIFKRVVAARLTTASVGTTTINKGQVPGFDTTSAPRPYNPASNNLLDFDLDTISLQSQLYPAMCAVGGVASGSLPPFAPMYNPLTSSPSMSCANPTLSSSGGSAAGSPNDPQHIPYLPMHPSPVGSVPASPPQRPMSASIPTTTGQGAMFPQSAPSSPFQMPRQVLDPMTNMAAGQMFSFTSPFEGASTKAALAVGNTGGGGPMADLLGLHTGLSEPVLRPTIQTAPSGGMGDLGGVFTSLSLSSPMPQESKLLLSSSDAKGLEIHGSIDRDPGAPSEFRIQLTLSNKSMSLLSNFSALKLNTNIFGFQAHAGAVCHSIPANQSQTVHVQLLRSNATSPPQESIPDTSKATPLQLQAALRMSTGVHYFLIPFPFRHVFKYAPEVKSGVPDPMAVSWLANSVGTVVEFSPLVPPALVCNRVVDKLCAMRAELIFGHAPSMLYRMAATLINDVPIVFQLQASTGKLTVVVACRRAKYLEEPFAVLLNELGTETAQYCAGPGN